MTAVVLNPEVQKAFANISARNRGYITTSDLEEIGMNKNIISKLVRDKKLIRIRKGLYIDDDYKLDRYYIMQSYFRNVTFSYRSALYLLGYLDDNPTIELTSSREIKYNRNQNYIIHKVKPEYYNIGLMELESPNGHKIRLYNIERTICDVVKNGNWFETIEFEKVLIKYFKSKTKNIPRLLEYAKLLKVEKNVAFIVEVMDRY